MAPRRRCPTCGSKQWHKEPSSGMIACSEGHVLQNYRNETTEITEVGPHAMKKRTLKSGRGKKGEKSSADPKLYHGARGRYHYFLCLQLILRKQISALTALWDLPPEFEVICRDLWALNLALLPDPPPAEPYHHAQENRAGGAASEPSKAKDDPESETRSSQDSEDPAGSDDEEEQEHEDPEKNETGTQDADADEDDLNSELDALMRENSEISSSSDDDGGGVDLLKPGAARKKNRPVRGRLAYESPVSTIAVLVLACWTMRIPVLYRDFSRIIESYELPYLDAVMHLPSSMVQHLTKHNVQALSPPHAPGTMGVHSLASRLAKKVWVNYGIYTPEANGASMLWRITKYMGGTPLLYRLTKRVASVLSVPLTLNRSLAPGLDKVKPTDAFRHRYDNAPSEVGLLAALVIVVKMVHGLDGTTRSPADGEDVACGLGSAKEYLRLIEEMTKEDRLGTKFDSRKSLKVGDMSPEEVDEYIGFCSAILVGSTGNGDGAVEQYSNGGGNRVEVRLGGTEEAGLRPGAEYKIWNSRDVDGMLPEAYEKVVQRAVEVVGVPREYIGGVVEMFERRLVRWSRRVTT